MPKVSVILPVYNTEKYLRECLDSVVNQTLKDIEIICVNDGSTDNSLAILNEYAQKDNRITIISQKNKGAGATRNKGLKIAKGEYLYFLDSDDFLTISGLEKLYNKSIETDCDICVCLNNKYNSETKQFIPCNWAKDLKYIRDLDIFNRNDIPENFFQFCNIPAFTKLYKTEFIANNKILFQKIKTCNDVFFNFCTLSSANKITVIKEELVTYRLSNEQISKKRENSIECILIAFKELKIIQKGLMNAEGY